MVAADLTKLIRFAEHNVRKVWGEVRWALLLFMAAWIAATTIPLYRLSEFIHPTYRSFVVDGFANSLSIHVLRWLEADLLPKGEVVLAIGPWDAFMVVAEIGAAIAALVTVPYLLARFFFWAAPALTPQERSTVRWLGALSLALFVAGLALGMWVLPWLYAFSFQLQGPAGVANTVSLTEFLSETALFTVGLGAAFEIPTICAGLAYAGLLSAETMKRNGGMAMIATVALAFLISPGVGGGLIEGPIWGILFGLYVLGYFIVKRIERSRARSTATGSEAMA